MRHSLNSHTNETQFVQTSLAEEESLGFVLYFWLVFICFPLEKSRPWCACLHLPNELRVRGGKVFVPVPVLLYPMRLQNKSSGLLMYNRAHIQSSKPPQMARTGCDERDFHSCLQGFCSCIWATKLYYILILGCHLKLKMKSLSLQGLL